MYKKPVKKVLHVSYSMNVGGAERALFQLTRAQKKESSITPALIILGRPGYYAEMVESEGISVFKNANGFRFFDIISVLRLFGQYNIVHFHSPHPFWMLLSFFCRHTSFVYTHRAGRHKYRFKRKLVYWLTGIVVKYLFKGVSANTKFAADVVSELFSIDRNRVFVTYNGIDFSILSSNLGKSNARKELNLPLQGICIGTTANLRKLKRVDLLIRTIKELGEEYFCCVVGSGPELENLRKLASELGISDRCFFTGKLNSVIGALKTMDYFVFTSDHSESFGNSVVEAMGVGIPSIVMSDSPAMSEHVGNMKNLVVSDLAGIVEIISYMQNNEDLRNETSLALKEYVTNKYTYENSVAQYLKLYKSV